MRKTILLVDDEPAILLMTTTRLKKNGYDVITARTGREALDKIKEHAIEIILIDLMLPEITGAEVCSQLKNTPAFKKIPIILFTAQTNQLDIKTALGCGANDIITKPFTTESLLSTIKNYIQ
jgi:CheY-like chemotaxis protein